MVERSPIRLRNGGYDLSQWGSIDSPVAALNWLATHQDPMSFTGTVQFAPQLVERQALL